MSGPRETALQQIVAAHQQQQRLAWTTSSTDAFGSTPLFTSLVAGAGDGATAVVDERGCHLRLGSLLTFPARFGASVDGQPGGFCRRGTLIASRRWLAFPARFGASVDEHPGDGAFGTSLSAPLIRSAGFLVVLIASRRLFAFPARFDASVDEHPGDGAFGASLASASRVDRFAPFADVARRLWHRFGRAHSLCAGVAADATRRITAIGLANGAKRSTPL